MYEFDECLRLAREIKEINEQIEELTMLATAPKGQRITGMPSGGGGMCGSEVYIEKKEKLEQKRNNLIIKRAGIWECANRLMKNNGVYKEHRTLMKTRFYYGNDWKTSCNYMKEWYPDSNWNMNKVFRVYKNVLKILKCS